MKQKSEKNKDWEKDRRDRLNKTFETLAKLLPEYNPSKPFSKVEILQRAILLLQNFIKNKDLLVGSDKGLKYYEELEITIKTLRTRNDQLVEVLRKANVPIPEYNAKNTWIRNVDLDNKIAKINAANCVDNVNQIKITEFDRPKKYANKITEEEADKLKEQIEDGKKVKKKINNKEVKKIITTVPEQETLPVLSNEVTTTGFTNNLVVPKIATGIFLTHGNMIQTIMVTKKQNLHKKPILIRPRITKNVDGKIQIARLKRRIVDTRVIRKTGKINNGGGKILLQKSKTKRKIDDKNPEIPVKIPKLDLEKNEETAKKTETLTVTLKDDNSVRKDVELEKPDDLNTSDLSNDLFTLPNGSNQESLSPTAAYLLTFPLVSSKLPEEEENNESQSSPSILQIDRLVNCEDDVRNDVQKENLLLDENFSTLFSPTDANLYTLDKDDKKQTNPKENKKSDLEICKPIIQNSLQDLQQKNATNFSTTFLLPQSTVTTSSRTQKPPLNSISINQIRPRNDLYLPVNNFQQDINHFDMLDPRNSFKSYEVPSKIDISPMFTFSLTSSTNTPTPSYSSNSSCNTTNQLLTTESSCRLPFMSTTNNYDLNISSSNFLNKTPGFHTTTTTTIPTTTTTTSLDCQLSKINNINNYNNINNNNNNNNNYTSTKTTLSTNYLFQDNKLKTPTNYPVISHSTDSFGCSPSIETKTKYSYPPVSFTFSLTNPTITQTTATKITTTTTSTILTTTTSESSIIPSASLSVPSNYYNKSTKTNFSFPFPPPSTNNNSNTNFTNYNHFSLDTNQIADTSTQLKTYFTFSLTTSANDNQKPKYTMATTSHTPISTTNYNNSFNTSFPYEQNFIGLETLPQSLPTTIKSTTTTKLPHQKMSPPKTLPQNSKYHVNWMANSDFSMLPPLDFTQSSTLIPQPTISSMKSDIFFAHPPDDNFPWSPNKMSNLLDQTSNHFISSTLPLLSGEIFPNFIEPIKTSTITTTTASDDLKKKEQQYQNLNQNFFSVSQLVEPSSNNNNNNNCQNDIGSMSSGVGGGGGSGSGKSVSESLRGNKVIPKTKQKLKFDEPKRTNVGKTSWNFNESINFNETQQKSSCNIYSAEALIGNTKKEKTQNRSYNVTSDQFLGLPIQSDTTNYFPPMDLNNDPNFNPTFLYNTNPNFIPQNTTIPENNYFGYSDINYGTNKIKYQQQNTFNVGTTPTPPPTLSTITNKLTHIQRTQNKRPTKPPDIYSPIQSLTTTTHHSHHNSSIPSSTNISTNYDPTQMTTSSSSTFYQTTIDDSYPLPHLNYPSLKNMTIPPPSSSSYHHPHHHQINHHHHHHHHQQNQSQQLEQQQQQHQQQQQTQIGTGTLTNFNLTTICPEINDKDRQQNW